MKQTFKENFVVSARGQITLPAAMRRAFSDVEIAAWDKADVFRPGEQKQIKARLKRQQP